MLPTQQLCPLRDVTTPIRAGLVHFYIQASKPNLLTLSSAPMLENEQPPTWPLMQQKRKMVTVVADETLLKRLFDKLPATFLLSEVLLPLEALKLSNDDFIEQDDIVRFCQQAKQNKENLSDIMIQTHQAIIAAFTNLDGIDEFISKTEARLDGTFIPFIDQWAISALTKEREFITDHIKTNKLCQAERIIEKIADILLYIEDNKLQLGTPHDCNAISEFIEKYNIFSSMLLLHC